MPADTDTSDLEVLDAGGLDFGISLFYIRMLCENPWDGGGGYTPNEVAQMTPDQIYMRLCDKKLLAKDTSGSRVVKTSPGALRPDKDGCIKVRLEDGTVVKQKLSDMVRSQ